MQNALTFNLSISSDLVVQRLARSLRKRKMGVLIKLWEKKEETWLSPIDKSTYTHRKIQEATWRHQKRHQKLRLHNDCGPT